MNCFEFRRRKLTDPRRLDAEALAHACECAGCRAFAQEIDDTDQQFIRAAAPAVPQGLEDRILLRRRGGPLRRIQTWAMAASILVMSGIGYAFWTGELHANYAQLAIGHVLNEPESFTTVRNDDTEFFRKALADFGGRIDGSIGRVRYMKLCPEHGATGWHVVLETGHGLATLILIPGKTLQGQSVASTDGWHALARSAGRGYYAIVTNAPETTAAVQALIQRQVNWAPAPTSARQDLQSAAGRFGTAAKTAS